MSSQVLAYTVMAYKVMAYIAMVYIVMVYIVMVYIVIVYVVMVCIVMVYTGMAEASYQLPGPGFVTAAWCLHARPYAYLIRTSVRMLCSQVPGHGPYSYGQCSYGPY